jgi:hypothetical protein
LFLAVVIPYLKFQAQTAEKFGAALAKGMPIPLPSLQIGVFSVDDPASHINTPICSEGSGMGMPLANAAPNFSAVCEKVL